MALRTRGKAPVGAQPEEQGFLFTGTRSIQDYRERLAAFPRLRDRPGEREPLLELDGVLDALEAANVPLPAK